MSWFYNTVALLKEYGRLGWANIDMVMMLGVTVYGIVCSDTAAIGFSAFFLAMIGWEITDVYLYQKRDSYKQQLADKEDEVVMLKGENAKLKEEVERLGMIIRDRKDNPIKSNRIVNDKAFALRFKCFVEEVRCSDPMSEKEADYLIAVAERLLKWQTKTVHKDSEEYQYLERLNLMPEPSANAEEHAVEAPKEVKPKKRTAPKKKTKTAPQENENKN